LVQRATLSRAHHSAQSPTDEPSAIRMSSPQPLHTKIAQGRPKLQDLAQRFDWEPLLEP
jgi:hypothetical protein